MKIIRTSTLVLFAAHTLLVSAAGNAQAEGPAIAKEKIAVERFFSSWIRYYPGSTFEVTGPLGQFGDFRVYRFDRKALKEKFNDQIGTIFDVARQEIFVGEVMFNPDMARRDPFDESTDGPKLAAELARVFRSETGLARTPETDRAGLLSFRAVIKTPIGPYGQDLLVSTDHTLLLLGKFVPAGSDPIALRRQWLSSRKGPRRDMKKVTVHEFADLECAFCRKRTRALEEFLAGNPAIDATIEFHNFPLYVDHKWSPFAAADGVCLAEIGSDVFYRYQKLVFDKQETMNQEAARGLAADIVSEIGAAKKFEDCAGSRLGSARVLKDLETGEAIGVRSTPTFIVDGVLISGEEDLIEDWLRAKAVDGAKKSKTTGKTGTPSKKQP